MFPTRYFLWAIVFVGFLVFCRMLFNGFVGDDIGYMQHPFIQQGAFGKVFIGGSADLGGASPISGQFYRPIMLVFFTLIYSIVGNNAFLYHFVQVGFHIASAFLLFLLFKKFFSNTVSFLLSLVFLVHPMVVETVAYVSDLQDVLFVFFGLSALTILVRVKRTTYMLIFFSVMLLLCLLSKETGIVFAGVSVIYALFFQKEKYIHIFCSVFIMVSVYAFIRFGIGGVGVGGVVHTQMETLLLSQRLMLIPSLLYYYFATFVFPKDLALAQTWIRIPSSSELLLQYTFVVSIICGMSVYAYILYKKTQKTFFVFGFFFLWFLLSIGLHLQILPLEMTVADRWFYAPMIGVLGIIGVLLSSIEKKKYFGVIGVIICVIICLFSMRSCIRIGDFVNEKTLYEHDVKITKSYLLEHSLGYQYLQEQNYPKAYEHITRSIAIFPTTQSMNSLGVYYYKVHNRSQAITWFKKSIEKGDNFLTYNNLIQLYLKEKSYRDAKPVLVQATKKFPQNDMGWYLLSLTEYKLGNHAEALTAAKKAYTLSQTPVHQYVYRQLQLDLPIQFND